MYVNFRGFDGICFKKDVHAVAMLLIWQEPAWLSPRLSFFLRVCTWSVVRLDSGALNALCTTCLVTNHSPFQISAHLCTTALPWRLNQRCETEAQHEPPNNIISHIQKSSSRIVMFCEELICETDIVDLGEFFWPGKVPCILKYHR